MGYAENLGIDIPEKIDSRIFLSITKNKLINLGSELKNDQLRNRLFEFSQKIKNIQHYFFHSKMITVTRLLGKLLTRIWWIYHTSSPLMRSMKTYDTGPALELTEDSDEETSDDEEYEESSQDGEEEDSEEKEESSGVVKA